MGGIDSRIVIVGLPTVGQQLHADPEQLIWITQSYVLATTVCLLLVGRIGDMYGRVKSYNLGFVVFTLGSGLSALSGNALELIAFRVVQGVGSAIIFANAGAIITDASKPGSLGMMLGLNQVALRGGSMLGLTLSGLILTVVDWRGLFYVNVPIGIFGTIWAYKNLREISTRDHVRLIDWYGFVSFTVGLSLVLLGITFLGYGMQEALLAYTLLVVGLTVIAVFVKIESKSKSPLLDLRLFKIRLFAMGNLSQFLNSLAWTGIILLLAFYLQIALGYSAFRAGIGLIPVDVAYLSSTLIASRLTGRFSSRYLSTGGLAINLVGYLFLSTFSSTTNYYQIALAISIIGVGNGLFNVPNAREVMRSVPPDRRGVASGLRNMMPNMAITLSYGLVIVLITAGISYSSLTDLLEGTSSVLLGSTLNEFVTGFRIASISLAAIIAIAIITSCMRGKREVSLNVGPDSSGS